MAKRQKIKDPYASREAKKYDNPIPSREFLIDFLTSHSGPMSHRSLCRALEIDDYEQQEAIQHRLHAMVRDGQLVRNRRGAFSPISKMDLLRGRVLGHKDGYGFVEPTDGSDDLYLHNRQMRKVFDGDEVMVHVSGLDHRGRREANIVEVIQRNTHQLVGRYHRKAGYGVVVPDNQRISHDILIALENSMNAKEGQFVVVTIVEQPAGRQQPSGEITEVLGDHMAPGMEIDVAIRSYEIPHQWPDQVLAETSGLGSEPTEADKLHRVDLRQLPLVTIDGEDAKDFDDAVYCETKKSGGWRLWVAIADVSHYVQVNTALDKEAFNRGTSVYFPERVVPMLPEVISNGLCSLNPSVDRLCMVCEMTISAKGRVSGYRFYEAVMHSHARLTYTEVGKMLDPEAEQHSELREQFAPLVKPLENLHGLYKTLLASRRERGAIDFETVETQIIFGRDRKIDAIVPRQRNDAHKLIEECMLCANVCAARFLEKHKLDGLFRVHKGPSGRKLNTLRDYLSELLLDLGGGDKPSPQDYQALMASIGDRPDRSIIQTMMLRSMSQAVYQPDNLGHFGLAYTAYAHFTSPIRRYPDLLVHRAIRHIVRSNKDSHKDSKQVQRVPGAKAIPVKQIYPYQMDDMLMLGEHCSLTERRADDATRDVVSWLKCEYLQDHVGDVFEGVITAVTGFGLFVELTDVYVEGLVHITSLSNDYYHFDAARQRLVGERQGNRFHMGDAVTVQVAKVNLDDRKIDLLLLESAPSNRKPRKRPAGGKSAKGKSRGGDSKVGSKAKKGGKKSAASKGKSSRGVRRSQNDSQSKSGSKASKKTSARKTKSKKR